MKTQKGFFYILTNKRKNVLYAGSTKNLMKRVKQHSRGYNKGFTYKYNVNELICYEIFESIQQAKDREERVKGWTRKKKIELIESKNREWKNLYDDLLGVPSLRSGEGPAKKKIGGPS